MLIATYVLGSLAMLAAFLWSLHQVAELLFSLTEGE